MYSDLKIKYFKQLKSVVFKQIYKVFCTLLTDGFERQSEENGFLI